MECKLNVFWSSIFLFCRKYSNIIFKLFYSFCHLTGSNNSKYLKSRWRAVSLCSWRQVMSMLCGLSRPCLRKVLTLCTLPQVTACISRPSISPQRASLPRQFPTLPSSWLTSWKLILCCCGRPVLVFVCRCCFNCPTINKLSWLLLIASGA